MRDTSRGMEEWRILKQQETRELGNGKKYNDLEIKRK